MATATAPVTTALTAEPVAQPNATPVPAGRDWLPEDLRASPSLEKFKTPGDVAKSYLELEKMASGGVRIPKADAKPEEWGDFYKKLGRPESPDKYEFKRPEMPDGLHYDEDLENAAKNWAHKAGLNNHSMQIFVDEFHQFQLSRTKAVEEQARATKEAVIADLKKEWGASYDDKLGSALNALKQFGGEKLKSEVANGIGNNPELIRAFAIIAERNAEDSVVKANGTEPPADDEATIRAKIAAMYDPKHPYMNDRMDYKLRDAAQQEMLRLQGQLVALAGKDLTKQ